MRNLITGLPAVLPLAQPALVAAPPTGSDWAHEVKLDGYRILARMDAERVVLTTRPGSDWTASAPGVVDALRSLHSPSTVIDGEAVLLRDGTNDFHGLRSVRSSRRGHSVVYVAFDLLVLRGKDLRSEPLETRRAALSELMARADVRTHVSLAEQFEAEGALLFAAVCGRGLEGIVSKRRNSRYPSGRTRDWVKSKNPTYRRIGADHKSD